MLRLTQQFWICCVSVGLNRVIPLFILFLLSLLIAACVALLWTQGVPLGAVGAAYFALYAGIAAIIAGFTLYTAISWCRRGRQKRSTSGQSIEILESEV
jgi:hypothetical protein